MGPCCWWSVTKDAGWRTGLRGTAGQGPAGDRRLVRRGPRGRAGDRAAGRRVDRRLRPGRRPAARRHGRGWQARASGDWITVCAPGRRLLQVHESEEMRAVGFSPDGATFVIATSPGLAIYRRQDEGQ